MTEVQQRHAFSNQVDVAVNGIRFLDDAEAEVSFSLILPAQTHPGMAMPQGYAVLQNGRWKVARETYAATVGRIGVQIPPLSTQPQRDRVHAVTITHPETSSVVTA